MTLRDLMDLEDTYPTEEKSSLIQIFNFEDFDTVD